MIKKLLHQFSFFRCCGDSTNARWKLITNPRLMSNTRLFATVLERLVLFPINSFMTKNDFVKASRGEFSKTQQINYSTVLPRLATNGPRLPWVHFRRKTACKIYFPMNLLERSVLWGTGDLYHICFFSPCFFIYSFSYFFVCLFIYLFLFLSIFY